LHSSGCHHYIILSKKDECEKISKSIVTKLNVEQLIGNILNDIPYIFSDNVRLFVGNETQVDYPIISSILNDSSMFHILHNGISIVCLNYLYGFDCLRLDKASIVNGAQTIFNIYKLINLGIIELESLRYTYILAKIIQVASVDSQETKSIISIAANTQKAISSQDLKANDKYLRNYRLLMARYSVNLEIKRGSKISFDRNVKIEKLAKILDSSLKQRPGFARNTSLKIYFDDEDEYESIFNYTLNIKSNNLRVLIILIFLEYSKYVNLLNTKIENAAKYADLYFVAYIFGNIILNSDLSEDDLDSDKLEISKISYLTEKYSVDFVNKLKTEIKDEESKNLFNTFRKEELYRRIFNAYEKVKIRVNEINDIDQS